MEMVMELIKKFYNLINFSDNEKLKKNRELGDEEIERANT
jgi:hypothetical protein